MRFSTFFFPRIPDSCADNALNLFLDIHIVREIREIREIRERGNCPELELQVHWRQLESALSFVALSSEHLFHLFFPSFDSFVRPETIGA